MDEMDESLKEIPTLLEQLHDVSKLNIKHSQLATARENMKHIFMVPETVRQAEQLIQARISSVTNIFWIHLFHTLADVYSRNILSGLNNHTLTGWKVAGRAQVSCGARELEGRLALRAAQAAAPVARRQARETIYDMRSVLDDNPKYFSPMSELDQ